MAEDKKVKVVGVDDTPISGPPYNPYADLPADGPVGWIDHASSYVMQWEKQEEAKKSKKA